MIKKIANGKQFPLPAETKGRVGEETMLPGREVPVLLNVNTGQSLVGQITVREGRKTAVSFQPTKRLPL